MHETVCVEIFSHSEKFISLYFKHIQQIKEQQTYEITHNDGLRQQYDDKILQEIQQLRTQNDQELVAIREEIAAQYEKKVCSLQM